VPARGCALAVRYVPQGVHCPVAADRARPEPKSLAEALLPTASAPIWAWIHGTLVDLLRFGQFRKQTMGALSGGTRQKLNLTLALMRDPHGLAPGPGPA
jgi:hypothetical protein